MAGTFTTAFSQDLVDYLCSNTAITGFTAGTMYMGLVDADPGAGGTSGTELSGGAYGRVSITFGAASAADPSVATNSSLVDFGTATADWNGGTVIPGFVIFTAATGTNRIAAGTLTTAKAVTNGDSVSFAVGAVAVSLT